MQTDMPSFLSLVTSAAFIVPSFPPLRKKKQSLRWSFNCKKGHRAQCCSALLTGAVGCTWDCHIHQSSLARPCPDTRASGGGLRGVGWGLLVCWDYFLKLRAEGGR